MGTRCGLVTLVGRTNVGKSTLLNRIVGAKVSIVPAHPQTTIRAVQGVLTAGDRQAVFVDTPGLHKPVDRMGESLLDEVRGSLEHIDLVLAVVEPGDRALGGTRHLVSFLEAAGSPLAFLVVNKVDRVVHGDPAVRITAEELSRVYPFKRVYPISASAGTGVEGLVHDVLDLLPEGPFLYPEDEISNVPQQFYAAEILREKAMAATEDEIPHSIGVEILELTKSEDGAFTIRAVLYVDRESRKGILIGAGGKKIKEIGSRAREELQDLLEAPVHLMTEVKVRKDWRKRPRTTGH